MRLDKDKLLTMLEMQAGMNAKINPEWLTAGYPFMRAAMIEGAEAIEHMGWKWWKAQTRDVEQLRMELVDIWHFALSHTIVLAHELSLTDGMESTSDGAAEYLLWGLNDSGRDHVEFDVLECYMSDMDELSRMELLIGLAVTRSFNAALFETLLKDAGMTWDDLYVAYVGKNVLNFFRQDHGYKDGTYQKIWRGREDNEHLTEIMAALDPAAPAFRDLVYSRLDTRYMELTGVGVPQ